MFCQVVCVLNQFRAIGFYLHYMLLLSLASNYEVENTISQQQPDHFCNVGILIQNWKFCVFAWQQNLLSVLQPFISFVVEFQMDKAHNMFAFMFDPWYKNLEIRELFG